MATLSASSRKPDIAITGITLRPGTASAGAVYVRALLDGDDGHHVGDAVDDAEVSPTRGVQSSSSKRWGLPTRWEFCANGP
jgi:hypothetical protein